jgi:1-acyl-sn-glycerol-3-phosphate acyltransferase
MEDWVYAPAPDLDQTYLARLRRFPREPDMLTYALRSSAALALRAWLRAYHRLRIEGRRNLPAEGSYVLIANHTSHLDSLALLSVLPLRKLHRAFPAAAQDYFFTRLSRLAVSAVVANALPFDREVHVRHSLQLCRALLENPGNVLVVFPEGTRSRTRTVAPFKPGIGWLLAGTPIPAVPCYIDGAQRAWPKGGRFPRPWKVRVVIGAPRTFADCSPGRESARRISRELREAVLAVASGHGSEAASS